MINLTNDIKIIVEGNQLLTAINHAIQDTHRTLLSIYAPGKESVSLSQITASRDNSFKSLAFNRYFPLSQSKFDENWIKAVFLVVHNHTGDEAFRNHKSIFIELGIDEDIPATLARELWRGLRIFLLALWSQKAVLLPMTFSLPASGRKGEYAQFLYTEVLAIFRKPFDGNSACSTDISLSIKPRAMRNFDWYAWRPILASDWHTVEDINNIDLIALFKELAIRGNLENKNQEAPAYPLSPHSFLGPIVNAIPNRCKFDTEVVSNYNPRIIQASSALLEEVLPNNFNTAYLEIKKVWVSYQQRYLTQLREIKRIKNIKKDEKVIGQLNYYLFSLLPQGGYNPPYPVEFGRKHIEGIGVPPFRKLVTKRDDISALERFFQYLEDISPFESDLIGFVNPIMSLDKPRELRSRQTKKKTFSINDFRFFYEMVHAIGEFAWYVAIRISEGNAPKKWAEILNFKNANLVLNTEEFDFVPIVNFTKIDGTPIQVNLRWLPISVLPTVVVHLINSPNQWTHIPNLLGIHEVITGLETGLRHIHIRWLDKRNFKANPVDSDLSTFDLLVNTDKVTNEWIRPTAKSVLTALERQLESQSWIVADHFDTELFYDYHELSDFGKICPIFMKYNEAQVYSASSMALLFKSLVYFFNQLKVGVGQSKLELLPDEIKSLKFNCRDDFETAMRCRNKFTTMHTPHGLRASVVSIFAPILPPHIIGENITGHVSENMVRYYTVIDSDYMDTVKQHNKNLIFGNETRRNNILSIRADGQMSRLRNAVAASPVIDVLRDYGAFSFANEEMNGEVKSGMNAINGVTLDDIKINPTHICPLGNQCPPEIVSTIGAKSCGQCHYSIKTIDHLPRILAHCRALSRQFDHVKTQLSHASGGDASEEVLESIEGKLLCLGAELSAWALTAKVLTVNYEQLKDAVLVNKPEIISQKLLMVAKPDSELENLLVQCDEAIAYPELADSDLHADVAMVRARILAIGGSIEELFVSIDNCQLVDSFRGVLRGICLATGKSPRELAEQMNKPIVIVPTDLQILEKIYD